MEIQLQNVCCGERVLKILTGLRVLSCQEKVFELLYKISDAGFLAAYKPRIDVSSVVLG